MKRKEVNSLRMPVYRDAGFELSDAVTTQSAFKNESEHSREPDLYIYSRYRNPTVVSAEEEIMKMEGCEWALLTQSGMSAIDIALSVFQHGDESTPWLFFTEIYGGTISFIECVLKKRRGQDIHYFTPVNGAYDLTEFEKVIVQLKPGVVYIESVSNPLLIVTDVPEVIRIAKKYGIKVIVDNTFATPLLFKPLNVNADIVIHSATKYLSGHGNLSAGVLCGNDIKLMQDAIEYRKFVGHMISPDDAYRLQTQLMTFELRFSQQCENAVSLAEYLHKIPVLGKVWFPGLLTHETYNIAEKLFRGKGYGAMITLDFDGEDLKEKRSRRDDFISMVSEKVKLIPTLGDPNTILMPVEAVWGVKYPEPGMLRLSVGFEKYKELESVISRAFDGIIRNKFLI
jgi:cystathionine beta-lyase/cystathionine gamma-synthase